MKVKVILSNSGGELDSRTIMFEGEDVNAAVSHAIMDVITEWLLAPGDIIRIVEECTKTP